MTIFNAPPRKMAGVPRGRVTQNLVRVNAHVQELLPGTYIDSRFLPPEPPRPNLLSLINASGSYTVVGTDKGGMTVPNYYNFQGGLGDGRTVGLSLQYTPATNELSGNMYANFAPNESITVRVYGNNGHMELTFTSVGGGTGGVYALVGSVPADFVPIAAIEVL